MIKALLKTLLVVGILVAVILIATRLFSAQDRALDPIVGHWHLLEKGEADQPSMLIFEIGVDSSVVSLYRNDTVGISWLNEQLDSLWLPVGHGWYPLVIDAPTGDQMGAKWHYDTTQAVYLQRYHVDADHLRQDFFPDDRLAVHLPTGGKSVFAAVGIQDVPQAELTLGYRVDSPNTGGQFVSLKLGDKIVDLFDPGNLNLFFEQHRVKLPERLRSSIKPILYFDRSIPDALVYDMQLFCSAIGFDTTYRVYEIDVGRDSFKLAFHPLLAPKLPEGVSVISDPANLLCLGLSIGSSFTSGITTKTGYRELPDGWEYGFYYFAPGEVQNFTLNVAFEGPANSWQAEGAGQYFVSAVFTTPVHRLWNGLQVGEPIQRYAHLQFEKDGEVYTRKEKYLTYEVGIATDGTISTIRVTSNSFLSAQNTPDVPSPRILPLWDHPDCRLLTP